MLGVWQPRLTLPILSAPSIAPLSTIYYEYLPTLQHPEVVCGDVEARVAARRVAGLQTQRRPAVARPGVDSPTTAARHWGYGDIM